ncbi:helix-turn-helix domain-containing protein [Candidatus Roizmanbacteria bacterium]|nr:helix-turn-helix domain-containing protein [Candidatus Roizmanbacteria bacterium]
MKNGNFKIKDASNDRKYFAMIPYFIVNHSCAYEQSLYLVMKRIASETGSCWASPQTIAKMMGVAPNTVRKYRKKLEQRGWIRKIGSRPIGRTNQVTHEYEIVDLWKLNIDFYSQKRKGSPDESFQHKAESLQPMLEKSAPVGNKEKGIDEELLKKIYAHYTEKIRNSSRLTNGGKAKIKKRLENYTTEELLMAIDNFSESKWWMENNSHQGVEWFFKNDERIDKLLNLKPNKKPEAESKYDQLEALKD